MRSNGTKRSLKKSGRCFSRSAIATLMLAVGCGKGPESPADTEPNLPLPTQAAAPDSGAPDLPLAQSEAGDGVRRDEEAMNGEVVDTYTWTDSQGRPRSVSLKREGATHGGYAVKMTYETLEAGAWRQVTVEASPGADTGFGYFVAHERYRDFADGTSGTLAGLHGEDDSPLGRGFAATGTASPIGPTQTFATHTFRTHYPKWGVKQPNAAGPVSKALTDHQRFDLPLAIQWTFQKGMDSPRIDFKVDLSAAAPGQLAFDVRGPYGVMEFADSQASAVLNNVQWGDSLYHFTTEAPAAGALTTGAGWNWAQPVNGSRPYHALLARHTGGAIYEMGLYELKLGADSGLLYSNYSGHRGTSRAVKPHDLVSEQFGDWEWPFQSAQYAGLSPNAAATHKKLAWGSASLYGSTETSQYLNDTQAASAVPYPSGGKLIYRTCLVLGVSTFTDASRVGLTRIAAASPTPSCAQVVALE